MTRTKAGTCCAVGTANRVPVSGSNAAFAVCLERWTLHSDSFAVTTYSQSSHATLCSSILAVCCFVHCSARQHPGVLHAMSVECMLTLTASKFGWMMPLLGDAFLTSAMRPGLPDEA